MMMFFLPRPHTYSTPASPSFRPAAFACLNEPSSGLPWTARPADRISDLSRKLTSKNSRMPSMLCIHLSCPPLPVAKAVAGLW